jgi:hypothetical protein
MIAVALAAVLFQGQDPTPSLIDELEQKMLRLAERLEKTEPDQAKTLRRGVKLLHERGASDRARAAVEEFLKGNSENSARHRDSVVTSLRRLLDLLEGRDRREPGPHMTPEELLIAVEEELARLIGDQTALNADARRDEGKPMTRLQAAAFAGYAERQDGLHARAAECARLLDDKGHAVFGYALGRAASDMGDLTDLLRKGDLSRPTRNLQDDVVRRLRDLLDALKTQRIARERDGSSGGDGGGNGKNDPHRIPDAAQLELIRRMQADLLRRTQEAGAGLDEVSEAKTAILRNLSDEQGKLAELMTKLIEGLK